MSDPIAVPLIMTSAGAQPTPATTLRAAVEQAVSAVQPGYTANLPGTLIEDVLSTEMGALTTIDQARVDAINCLSPLTASPYVLSILGATFGVAQGVGTNTEALVVFSGPVGFIVPAGTLVTDGTYQYSLQNATPINSNGQSQPSLVIATQSGIWTPLADTINTMVTQFSGYTITVTNPEEGTPGTGAQSVQSYRSQILSYYQAPAQAVPSYLTAALAALPGVAPRLVSILQVPDGWEVLCGGGDPYAVASTIYASVADLSSLVGSQTTNRNVNVSVIDAPNTYNIVYVNPPAQTVACDVVWNTNLPNFYASAQVNQLAQAALVSYINSIPVGQAININAMISAFQSAVSGLIPSENITALSFTVYINGSQSSPEAGTQIILSDPESYFSAAQNAVQVTQG